MVGDLQKEYWYNGKYVDVIPSFKTIILNDKKAEEFTVGTGDAPKYYGGTVKIAFKIDDMAVNNTKASNKK